MGVRPGAPTIETIVLVIIYEIIKFNGFVRSLIIPFSVILAKGEAPFFFGETDGLLPGQGAHVPEGWRKILNPAPRKTGEMMACCCGGFENFS